MMEPQFISFFDSPFAPLNPNVSSRAMAGEKLMLVEHQAKKGHFAKGDQHPNEQLTLVLSGKIKVTVKGQTRVLSKGDAVIIPSQLPHDVEVIEDCTVIEVFSPPRAEWLSKLKA